MKKGFIALLSLCFLLSGCNKIIDEIFAPDPAKIKVTNFASGFKSGIGLTSDEKGQIWVTENGTGANDAKVSVVSKSGEVKAVITGFKSIISPEDGLPAGLTHLQYRAGKLYILHGVEGKLYIVKTSDLKAGSPIKASTLKGEDIGTFVKSKKLSNPINTNLYNLTFGPKEDIYLVDAGANAVIKRNASDKKLSVFAKIPNPKEGVEAVPTGIVFDGSRFLVSALSGFPFSIGGTNISQVDLSGKVKIYKKGFTLLTDIVLTHYNRPLVLQFSKFENFSFLPTAGQLLDENGKVLCKDLMMPTSVIQANPQTFYVLNMASGIIQKLSY